MFGFVDVRLVNGNIESGKLLEFTTIPIEFRGDPNNLKVIVYGIVELDDGTFCARQLSEIRRPDAYKTNRA